MITRKYEDGLWKHLVTLHMALTPKEIDLLREIAVQMDSSDWEPGPNDSYVKLDLQEIYDDKLQFLKARLAEAIRQHAPHCQSLRTDSFDFGLLYYPDWSSVPWHRDTTASYRKYWRADVCVTTSQEYSAFMVPGGCMRSGSLSVPLNEGEGVLFCVQEATHSIYPTRKGNRLVVSVGTWAEES
jgi:hypothetical protein